MNESEIVAALRENLAPAGEIREQKMFGGTGFMLNGNMIAGTFRQNLLVRVGKDNEREALVRPGASRMEMRGRPMEGYVFFEAATLDTAAVKSILKPALSFVLSLPPKAAKKSAPAKGKRK